MLAQELASSLLKLDASYARKMLRHISVEKGSPSAAASMGLPSPSQGKGSSFDTNVVMILAVLLCALACALGLNSVVRYALRCSRNSANTIVRGGGEEGGGGVEKKVLRRMPTFAYSEGLRLSGVAECAICLSEFASGEKVKVLPRCNHGFHVRCIDRWLLVHPSCPICRQCLSGMCPKVYRCPGVASMVSLPPPSNIINPLDPEGLLIDRRLRF